MQKVHFKLSGAVTTIEISSEGVTTGIPARVAIINDGRIILEIIGQVKNQTGADGGAYPAVELSRNEQ